MTRSEKTEYIRTLYCFSCGYCGVTEADSGGGVLTRDHFKPLVRGGRNSVDNMVYACSACNRAKGDYFSDAPEERLLHPLRDNLADHLWRDGKGVYRAVSAPGAIFIRVLDLNRGIGVPTKFHVKPFLPSGVSRETL